MTDEELVVEFALTRLDHPRLGLDEVAALVVRRVGREAVLDLAARNLVVRGELRGRTLDAAAEQALRIVLTARDGEG